MPLITDRHCFFLCLAEKPQNRKKKPREKTNEKGYGRKGTQADASGQKRLEKRLVYCLLSDLPGCNLDRKQSALLLISTILRVHTTCYWVYRHRASWLPKRPIFMVALRAKKPEQHLCASTKDSKVKIMGMKILAKTLCSRTRFLSICTPRVSALQLEFCASCTFTSRKAPLHPILGSCWNRTRTTNPVFGCAAQSKI